MLAVSRCIFPRLEGHDIHIPNVAVWQVSTAADGTYTISVPDGDLQTLLLRL